MNLEQQSKFTVGLLTNKPFFVRELCVSELNEINSFRSESATTPFLLDWSQTGSHREGEMCQLCRTSYTLQLSHTLIWNVWNTSTTTRGTQNVQVFDFELRQ